jgi:hypothetical protein
MNDTAGDRLTMENVMNILEFVPTWKTLKKARATFGRL